MNLVFSMMAAPVHIKPSVVMKDLGITCLLITPHTMEDCIRFWCCENVPNELPPYLTEFKTDPYNWVGHGLTVEDANKISFYEKN